MRLGPAPKHYTEDGHRTVDPARTLERVRPLCDVVGVEAPRDITSLDRVGIPVYSISRRDRLAGASSDYNGKGASHEQAQASAIMEALERHSCQQRGEEVLRRTVAEMASESAIEPAELIVPSRVAPHLQHQRIAWVRGVELFGDEEVWVPANAVFHPYESRLDLPIFRYNTNGIASGNTLEEAVLHGMFEVIERDAWSICEFRRRPTADLTLDLGDGVACRLLRRFEEAGVEIHLKDLTSDVGVPTFGAASDDVRERDPLLLTVGVGTHLNPEVAAIRALTEVAQSRATQLHGVKMDPRWAESNRRLGYERMKAMNRLWFSENGGARGLSSFQGEDTMDVYEDIKVVLSKLRAAGFDRVIAVDLTREEIGVPVVRIIIPGMEVYAMDPEREGRRLRGRQVA